MTTLINSHTILKSTRAFISGDNLYRYRLTLSETNQYSVHVEFKQTNGTSAESILYKGDSLDIANQFYNKYSKG